MVTIPQKYRNFYHFYQMQTSKITYLLLKMKKLRRDEKPRRISGTLQKREVKELFFELASVKGELENNLKQIRTLIGLKPCFYNSIETQN